MFISYIYSPAEASSWHFPVLVMYSFFEAAMFAFEFVSSFQGGGEKKKKECCICFHFDQAHVLSIADLGLLL